MLLKIFVLFYGMKSLSSCSQDLAIEFYPDAVEYSQ